MQQAIDIDHITAAVCRHYGIRQADIEGKTRRQPVARARQVAIYMARVCTDMTLADIAARFGRTHATAIHAMRTVRSDLTLMATAGNLRTICNF